MDLCDRCTDSILACLSEFVPMDNGLHQGILAYLNKRYSLEEAPAGAGSDAGKVPLKMQVLLGWQMAIFGKGGTYNSNSEPGFAAQVFTKATSQTRTDCEGKHAGARQSFGNVKASATCT
jgi:hypothetical protein